MYIVLVICVLHCLYCSYIAIQKFRITLVVALVARLTPPGELFFNGCPDGGDIRGFTLFNILSLA